MEGGLRGLVHGASSAGKSALGRVFGSYLLRHVTEVLGVDEPQRVCQVRKEVTWDGGLRGPPPSRPEEVTGKAWRGSWRDAGAPTSQGGRPAHPLRHPCWALMSPCPPHALRPVTAPWPLPCVSHPPPALRLCSCHPSLRPLSPHLPASGGPSQRLRGWHMNSAQRPPSVRLCPRPPSNRP